MSRSPSSKIEQAWVCLWDDEGDFVLTKTMKFSPVCTQDVFNKDLENATEVGHIRLAYTLRLASLLILIYHVQLMKCYWHLSLKKRLA